MQVKRYEAASIQDALAKIKNDMGPDAIVLSTKRLPGESKRLEVMAARDDRRRECGDPIPRGIIPNDPAAPPENRATLESLKEEMDALKKLLQDRGREGQQEAFSEFKDCMNTFFDILGLRSEGAGKGSLPRVYEHLLGRGMSKAKACRLVDQIRKGPYALGADDFDRGLTIAEDLIREALAVSQEPVRESRVKVFLGPTGVGKTTTLAKLAARYALEQKKRVGLITTDTYRIAAIEQLKVYARIMDLPLEVATGREAFHRSMEHLKDRELILVDTPGRSRGEKGHLAELKEVLTGDWDLETNLLVCLTSSRECLQEVVERYRAFGYDQIILTKLDECTNCGHLGELVERADRPVSYITTGQKVPQDIEQASPARLAQLMMRH